MSMKIDRTLGKIWTFSDKKGWKVLVSKKLISNNPKFDRVPFVKKLVNDKIKTEPSKIAINSLSTGGLFEVYNQLLPTFKLH